MAQEISTAAAADRLGTSKPTVRVLIAQGLLQATRQPRGSRFLWRVDSRSVERFLEEQGRYEGRRRTKVSRLERLETELSEVRAVVERSATVLDNGGAIERERDDLRAQVVSLQEALSRSRAVAELQRDADAERASVIDHLLLASAAGERADTLRGQALVELEEALAGFTRPGHPGSIR